MVQTTNGFKKPILLKAILFFAIVFSTQKGMAQTDTLNIAAKIETAKKKTGTALVHTEKGKFKLYAVFKNNVATEWYATDMKGNRLKAAASNQSQNCKICVIMPDGVQICFNCTTGPTHPNKNMVKTE